jgi:hypothetical protein
MRVLMSLDRSRGDGQPMVRLAVRLLAHGVKGSRSIP